MMARIGRKSGWKAAGLGQAWSLAADALLVPESVELADSNCLVCVFGSDERLEPRKEVPPKGLYLAFVDLALPRTQPADFRDFARRWGTLGICGAHGEPGNHQRIVRLEDGRLALTTCCPPEGFGLKKREPIEAWRRTALRFRAFLTTAASLRQGQPADHSWWAEIVERQVELEGGWLGHLDLERAKFAEVVNRLAITSGVHLHLQWESDTPALKLGDSSPFGGSSLFGVLSAQLLVAVTGSGFALCIECGDLIPAAYARPRGSKAYCDACRPKATARRASSNYRASLRCVADLLAAGRSADAIAEKMGKTVEWVQRRERQVLKLKSRTRPSGRAAALASRKTARRGRRK
jgi:hypothetical protein